MRSSGRLADVRQGDERDHCGDFRVRTPTVPDLDVSATESDDGSSLRIAVINRHRTPPIRAELVVDGRANPLPARRCQGVGCGCRRRAGLEQSQRPDRVALRDCGVIDWSGISHDFPPPHSITLLAFAHLRKD